MVVFVVWVVLTILRNTKAEWGKLLVGQAADIVYFQ